MSVLPETGAPGLLPTGTVTFLFTDIEGSTLRWESHPAAMQAAVRRHDEVMRAAVAAHGGHVFKTVGDAFCVAFWRPAEALAAILEAQRALAAEDFSSVDDLRVRAALHTGAADERDGDYFGQTVNRVARLLAIAHGGQVLVSGVTSELMHGALPASATLRDLGEHRLRDLARPERVYQLLAPDLAAEFPPLRSLDELPNNLPLQFTSLVGREDETAELAALVDRHRLVTIVGSGGVGKTRTSLQVAANLLDGSGDGVWFIELAPLTSGEYIPTTVAQAMGLKLATDESPLESLLRALKAKRALLVFDNCEHMVEAAAAAIAAILRACPKIKVLASSRQGLGIAGEETYRLPSLGLPKTDEGEPVDAGRAMGAAAVALFVERARSIDKRFVLTDDNAPAVAAICRQLDGIPLAIELAASRVKILSPTQLRDRLSERFHVLTGGSRDVLPRQQTLRALIDWSHDLLDERERELFRSLGIFANGFTLEGAVAVGSGRGIDELDVLDVLASLVDKSLVLSEQDGEALRYRLLESTRVYALEKLTDAGERESLARLHLHYLRDRFVQLQTVFNATGSAQATQAAFASELEDLRTALDGALERGDLRAGTELLDAVQYHWRAHNLHTEGLTRAEKFLVAIPTAERRLRALAGSAAADAFDNLGRKLSAFELAENAVADARACGDSETLADVMRTYAWAAMRCGRFELADEALVEAEALAGESVRRRLELRGRRAFLAKSQGDSEGAARTYTQLLAEWRAVGSDEMVWTTAHNLAETEHECGRTERAIELARETLSSHKKNRDRSFASSLMNLAGYEASLGHVDAALAAASEAIAQFTRFGSGRSSVGVSIAIEHLALVSALRGDLERAARLGGFATRALEDQGYVREFTERHSFDRLAALLAAGLAPDDVARLRAEGEALKPEDAIALALQR